MNTEFIQQARNVFLAALDLPSSEQVEFVARECGDDSKLRERVVELLQLTENDKASDPVAPAVHNVAKAYEAAGAGVELDDFILREELGRGGMGVVWLAEQKSLKRQVALKLLRSSFATPDLLRRLEREAAILGRLSHPGIASVYAVGSAELGAGGPGSEQHFFAMEYVRGEPLDTFADRQELDTDARVELLAKVCDAVEHAHQQGVVHRDLKPDNILVSDSGQPKVLDFGIARATSSDVMTMTMQTAVGQVIGTVPYMSPEQVLGDSSQIDQRSDVYALGALLYQLLSGRLPADVQGRSIPEAARIIRDDDPTRLATIVTTCRGDVDTIVHKALEKDRERRYQSAAELAADIRRFLRHEPIVARPVSTFYQVQKFARRHKGLVAGLVATVVVLIAGVVIATTFAIQANRNAETSQRAAYSQSLMVASAAIADHDVATAERALLSSPAHLRGWEWRHLQSRLDMSLMKLPLPEDTVQALPEPRFSADGATLSVWVQRAGAADPAAVRLTLERWSLATGERLAPRQDVVLDAALDRMGGLAYADRETVHVLTTEPYRHVRLPRAAVLRDGWRAGHFLCTDSGECVVWDSAPEGAREEDFASHRIYRIDLSSTGAEGAREISRGLPHMVRADGRRIAVRTALNAGMSIWGEETGLMALEGHVGYNSPLGANADWSILAGSSQDGVVRTWNGDTGEPIARSVSAGNETGSVVVSADGTLVAAGYIDGLVRIWDSPGLEPRATLHGHRNPRAGWLTFSPDGALLASYAYQSSENVRVWDTSLQGDPWQLNGHGSYLYALAVSPDGRTIASGSWDHTVRLWDARTLTQLAVLEGHRDWIGNVAFSPDGETLASVDDSQRLLLWNVTDAAAVTRISEFEDYGLHAIAPLTWHPDGRRLVVGLAQDSVRVLDHVDASTVVRPIAALQEYRSGIVSGDGTRFVRPEASTHESTGYYAYALALCDAATGRELTRVLADSHSLKFAFSPVGAGPLRLLTPFERRDGPVQRFGWRLLDAATGAMIAEYDGGRSRTLAVAFAPDGSRFFTAGFDPHVRVWDTESFDELVQLQGHGAYVFRLVFGPDGATLYSASGDSTLRAWGTAPLRELLRARRRHQK